VFVKQAVVGVVREGAIAAGLTALMIMLFLLWRSTVVVMISIPLAILSSLTVLYFLGDTLNTMLPLAVGILVDDSAVRSRIPTACSPQATLHGAVGIAVPTLVSTLAISLRVHVVRLSGGAGAILVHPAWSCGRVRHAGLLWPVAYGDADHHRPFAQE
jgi:multidrug efflux pump subunit AcrB